KDIITGDEMFSDIYKIKESENGMMIEVEGKMISRSVKILFSPLRTTFSLKQCVKLNHSYSLNTWFATVLK
ncbi:hypothetical protein ACP6HZ_26465, partial [Vibrio harveyi]|uniref:hypothetical protein n=1 Tax=Vibrio harveyi TaxID=669 RepID=UPI003CEC05D2